MVLMKDSVPEEKAVTFSESLLDERYIKTATFISREQGQAELAELLGEDFVDIFETSPVPASVEITLDADYVSSDSLEVVKAEISKSPLVAEVNYQGSLVDALNANLSKISLILAFFIGLMLFISYVLINNTVRLNVYARRFTIHTMQLVGATRSFIRAPFLVQSAFQGVFSAFVAIMALIFTAAGGQGNAAFSTQVLPREGFGGGSNVARCAGIHQFTAGGSAARTHVHQVIGGAHDGFLVLHYYQRVAAVSQSPHGRNQSCRVAGMQPHGRFIQHKKGFGKRRTQTGGEAHALNFAAGERARQSVGGNVAQPHFAKVSHAAAQLAHGLLQGAVILRGG